MYSIKGENTIKKEALDYVNSRTDKEKLSTFDSKLLKLALDFMFYAFLMRVLDQLSYNIYNENKATGLICMLITLIMLPYVLIYIGELIWLQYEIYKLCGMGK